MKYGLALALASLVAQSVLCHNGTRPSNSTITASPSTGRGLYVLKERDFLSEHTTTTSETVYSVITESPVITESTKTVTKTATAPETSTATEYDPITITEVATTTETATATVTFYEETLTQLVTSVSTDTSTTTQTETETVTVTPPVVVTETATVAPATGSRAVGKRAEEPNEAKSAGDYYASATGADFGSPASLPSDTSEVSVTLVELPAAATGSLNRKKVKNAATSNKGVFWVSGLTVAALATTLFF